MPWERNTLSVEKQETLIRDKEAPAKQQQKHISSFGLNAMFQF